MVQKVTLVDDLDETEDPTVQTRHYCLGDQWYQVDLSEDNWASLIDSLEKFIAVSLSVPTPKGGPKAKKSVEGPHASVTHLDNAAVREWATRNGVPLKSRGQIPKEVKEQYLASLHDREA